MYRKILIICLIFSVVACTRFGVKQQTSDLNDAVTNYCVLLRWAMFDQALVYHTSKEGVTPTVDVDMLSEHIQVTSVKPEEIVLNAEQHEASVVINLSYYNKNRGTVKQFKLRQNWWQSDDGKRWFIASGFPEFK